MNIQEIYDYAKLATLSYVDLSEHSKSELADAQIVIGEGASTLNPGDTARIPIALGTQMLGPTTSISTDITGQWTVLDPYFTANPTTTGHSDPASGFAAMLVQNGTTGNKVLAIAGTEPSAQDQTFWDLAEADVHQIGFWGIALGQLVSLYNYVQVLRGTGKVEQLVLKTGTTPPANLQSFSEQSSDNGPTRYLWLETTTQADGRGLIADNDRITLTGHSLGGHLSALAVALFPDLFSAAVTFNAPGYNPPTSSTSGLGADNLLGLFTQFGAQPVAVSSISGKVTTFESEDASTGDDWEAVSGDITGTPFSSEQYITVEKNTHDVGHMMDSLALQAAFAKLDPSLDLAKSNELIKVASATTGKSYEELLRDLFRLFTGNEPSGLSDTEPTDGDLLLAGGGDFAARSTYYDKLIELTNKDEFKAYTGKVTIESVLAKSAAGMANLAKDEGANALAYRYALKAGNPFAVLGADYTLHNHEGELERYNPENRTGQLTDQYLADRAKYLTWKIQSNLVDKLVLDGTSYGYGEEKNWEFTDLSLDPTSRTITVKGSVPGFESTAPANKMIFGDDGANLLLGGAEADYLYGGGSTDVLEGGKGNDYLEGGAGLDLYRFRSDDGQDVLLDTDGSGLLQRNNELLTLAYARGDGQWAGSGFTASRSGDGKDLILAFTGSDDTITLKNYDFAAGQSASGHLGLHLIDSLPARPTPNRTYIGDTQDWDSDPGRSGVQSVTDANNNLIRADGQDGRVRIDEPGRYDAFVGSSDPDEIELYVTGDNTDIVYGDGADSATNAIGGVDRIELGDGRDWAIAGGGDDWVEGGAGGDILWGNAGNDVIYADTSVDGTLSLEEAIAIGENSVASTDTPDLLSGDDGNDTLIGGYAGDALLGGSGKDILIGRAGDDNLFGDVALDNVSMDWMVERSIQVNDDGGDIYLATLSNGSWQRDGVSGDADLLLGGAGDDWAFGGGGDDLISGGIGNDVLFGEAGADIIQGGDGNDLLIGDNPALVAGANEGDDILDGGAGNDRLEGDGGNDVLIGGTGDDILIGGKGKDTYIYNKGDGTDTIWDTPNGAKDPDKSVLVLGEGIDRNAIKFRKGSLFVDVGNGDGVHFEGFDSDHPDDTPVIGSIQFANGERMTYADILAQGFDIDGTDADDILWGTAVTDRMRGGAGNDILIAKDGDDVLEGGTGDDQLEGDGGDDIFVFNLGDGNDAVFDEGLGNTIRFGEGVSPESIRITNFVEWAEDLNAVIPVTCIEYGSGGDSIVMRQIHASANGDFLVPVVGTLEFADGQAMTYADILARGFDMDGTEGDDTLVGSAVNDTINGKTGSDTLYGNDGNDLLMGAEGDDLLYGGEGDDELEGNDGADTLDGGAGNDRLEGGRGSNTYLFGKGDGQDFIVGGWSRKDPLERPNVLQLKAEVLPTDIVLAQGNDEYGDLALVVSISGTADKVTIGNFFPGDNPYSLYNSVQQIQFADGCVWDVATILSKLCAGTSGDDVFRGTFANDVIYGGAGDDRLDGADGNDIVYGGDGNDILQGGYGDDVLNGGNGNDVLSNGYGGSGILNGGAGDDQLFGGSNDDIFDGGAGDDRIQCGYGNDVFLFGRGGGKDLIRGGSHGVNTLQLKADVLPTDIILSRGYDTDWGADRALEVSIAGTTDKVTINGFFFYENPASFKNSVQQIRFSDGTTWDINTIVSLVNGNHAPTMANAIDDQSVSKDVAFSFTVPADAFSDNDAGDSLTFSAILSDDSSLPTWLTFDSAARTFSGTPSMPGIYSVKVVAADTSGLNAFDVFDIAVVESVTTQTGENSADIMFGSAQDDRMIGNAGNDLLRGDSRPERIVIKAKASLVGDVGAIMELRINSELVGSVEVRSTTWADYAFDVALPIGNNVKLDVSFVNDAVIAGQDRNLYVSEVSVGSHVMKPGDAGVTLDRGAGVGAFDGANVIAGQSGVYWNGALRFTVPADITGVGGCDQLDGGAGNDVLEGGSGDDVLEGGCANDMPVSRLERIVVNARASLVSDVGAIMELRINSELVGSVEVRSTSWADYAFDVALPMGNDVKLDVSFVNDAVIAGQDRNLYVNQVSVGNHVMKPGDAGVTLDRGTGAGAFDGVNVLAGQSGVYWNGALRFTLPASAMSCSENDLLNGGAGNDTLIGGYSAELYLGGLGNDTLTTGAGNNVILFNKGDGQDTFAAGGTGSDTLSLGGDFAYSDLSFSKNSNDLVLKMGTSDQITFKDWYATTPSKPVVNLQVIAEAMADFDAGGSNPLLDQKVENFNFAGLVSAFDVARTADTTLTAWALSNALSSCQLEGSDSAAIGGDLAYQYGKNGTLAGIGLTAAQGVLGDASFGNSAQNLQPLASLQVGSVRLS